MVHLSFYLLVSLILIVLTAVDFTSEYRVLCLPVLRNTGFTSDVKDRLNYEARASEFRIDGFGNM